jgi:hypothetical protein
MLSSKALNLPQPRLPRRGSHDIVSKAPTIIEAIESMRASRIIEEDTAKFIVDHSRELQVWHTVLDQIGKGSPTIRNPQMAEVFRQLLYGLISTE